MGGGEGHSLSDEVMHADALLKDPTAKDEPRAPSPYTPQYHAQPVQYHELALYQLPSPAAAVARCLNAVMRHAYMCARSRRGAFLSWP